MEQRPLRAGDSVDDYCPRERRVTSHAIVAVVDDVIRQTRCLTCDAEHDFKAAKMPRPRKKTSALYDQVLANAGGQLVTPRTNGHPNSNAVAAKEDPVDDSSVTQRTETAVDGGAEPSNGASPSNESADPAAEDLWVGHRPLIRATLPRNGNDEPPAP